MESAALHNDNQKVADFVSLLNRCDNTEQAYRLFQQHIAMLGFEHSLYAYFFHAKNPDNRLYYSFDNYPQAFYDAYFDEFINNEQEVTVDWCSQYKTPLLWEGEIYQQLVKASPAYQQQNKLSHDFGIKHGFSLPFETGSRLDASGIGLSATDIGEREFKADILPNTELVQTLCHYLDSFIRSKYPAKMRGIALHTNLQRLTMPEQHCLQWLATGHSIRAIADEKLYRSTETINRHIRSAKTKLRADNRSQLIARAVLLGWVDPV